MVAIESTEVRRSRRVLTLDRVARHKMTFMLLNKICINNRLLSAWKICTDSCPMILSVPRSERSRATVSFEEQVMSKDNYSCIFPKPKVVYCLYYPSNISSHSESSGAKQNKTRSKTRRLLGAFWYCFLNKFPNFLISKVKKNAPLISKFVRQTGVIGCEWAS